MRQVDEDSLNQMTSKDLLALQVQIHEAIRAHIRQKNAEMAAASAPRPAAERVLPRVEQTRHRSLEVLAKPPEVLKPAPQQQPGPAAGGIPNGADEASILERERDAWLARRRAISR